MCRKLKAEQVRRGITNEDMGKIFGLTRQGYEYKLQNRSFKVDEIHKLCKLFDCSFEYLFEADESEHQKRTDTIRTVEIIGIGASWLMGKEMKKMKHKITLKRKDTGETLTIWSVFDNSGDCVEMQHHTDNETVPVEIEVLDHKLMFPGCTEEETIKMTEKVIRSGDLDNMIKSANEIFKMISEKLNK